MGILASRINQRYTQYTNKYQYMEVKIKLDWHQTQALVKMLQNGIEHHQRLAIALQNCIDSVEQIHFIEVMRKLHERLAIMLHRNTYKNVYRLTIKLSVNECFVLVNGCLPPQNNTFNDVIKYELYQSIQKSCFNQISMYQSRISPQKFIE